jgi:hypothetical protein
MDGENKTLLLIGRSATQGKVVFLLLFILKNCGFHCSEYEDLSSGT